MEIENDLQNLESMPFSEIRVKLTENMFYINVWNAMNTNQKVRLLQMLENNLSCIDGRDAIEVVIYPKLPNLASASKEKKQIKISEWHLTYGFNDLSDLNAQSYCSICHEHEHFNQFIDAESTKADKKTEECRINLKSIIPYNATTIQGYVEYRIQPIEYYAHKLSEEQTISTFTRLEREFGEDKGFRKWYETILAVSVENLVQLYNQEYCTTYTFDDLYDFILNKIAICEKKPGVK